MNNKGYIELAEQLGVSKKTIYMRVYKAKNPIKYRQYRDKYDAKRRSEYQVKKGEHFRVISNEDLQFLRSMR